MEIIVKGIHDNDFIKLTTEYIGMSHNSVDEMIQKHIGHVTTSIVNLQDQAIREALIILGWTPPEGETNV